MVVTRRVSESDRAVLRPHYVPGGRLYLICGDRQIWGSSKCGVLYGVLRKFCRSVVVRHPRGMHLGMDGVRKGM